MNRLTHISKQFYISKPHQLFHENNKLKISEELDYECMYHFLTPSLMFYIYSISNIKLLCYCYIAENML